MIFFLFWLATGSLIYSFFKDSFPCFANVVSFLSSSYLNVVEGLLLKVFFSSFLLI
jgi:hypothetical protein